ncbi:phosphocholine cytidylyltransferase family protein [Candidatus Methylomirabilis sp.]|uniref:phosphocholine cytidylyltransferase family protein n=1 Tax=Candidatus Methylomirabilis sp. TaxID=2032687 RepID=UPI002A65246A|nr:phosphocholine cytidylyltransferase family protein [Candidatus Methylomirabilis sp.]
MKQQRIEKAIILSAGSGRRLLSLTAELPKCLLPVDADHPVLELQLRMLAQCGIQHVTVMVGFGAKKVERFLATHPIENLEVHTRYNPFFRTTNTLVTCWLAIPEMTKDFMLLNGDTLFEVEVLRRVLTSDKGPVTLAIDQKAEYDKDDMKIVLDSDGQLKAVGKVLATSKIDGESIGLMVFRNKGVEAFRAALDTAIRDPANLRKWYHDVISTMAGSLLVGTEFIEGLWWTEIDTPKDFAKARSYFVREQAVPERTTVFSSVGDS